MLVVMVFTGLFMQYLLTEWLKANSDEERKKTWERYFLVPIGNLGINNCRYSLFTLCLWGELR